MRVYAQDTGRVLEPIIVPAQRDMPEMNVPQCCVMEFSLRTLPMCAMDMGRVKAQIIVPAQRDTLETLATITSATVLKQATQVQYALVTVLVSVSTRATAPQAMVATCATTPPAVAAFPTTRACAQDTGHALEPIIVPAQKDMPEMNVPQ